MVSSLDSSCRRNRKSSGGEGDDQTHTRARRPKAAANGFSGESLSFVLWSRMATIRQRRRSQAKLEFAQSRPNSLCSTPESTVASFQLEGETTQVNLPDNLSLQKCRRLLNEEMVELSIVGRPLDRRFARSFDRVSLKSLVKLNLSCNLLFRDHGIFRELVGGLPLSLQDLTISWNGMDRDLTSTLARRLRYMDHMESIFLSGNPIGPDGLLVLLNEGKLHHIRNVTLWDCDLGDAGAITLGCQFWRRDVAIERLDLSMNSIGDDGIKALATGLQYNGTLRSLDLYCNDIQDLGVQSLVDSLSKSNSCVLTELSLRANRIGPRGAWALASGLGAMRLENLHLGHNEILDEGAQFLASALESRQDVNQRLNKLALSCNFLTNKSATAFAKALSQTETALEVLAMEGNIEVDRRGASSFCQCLEENVSLRELRILDRTYENHLLNDKLDFWLQANWLGRKHLKDYDDVLSDSLWPFILARTQNPSHLYLFLKERPHLAATRHYVNCSR